MRELKEYHFAYIAKKRVTPDKIGNIYDYQYYGLNGVCLEDKELLAHWKDFGTFVSEHGFTSKSSAFRKKKQLKNKFSLDKNFVPETKFGVCTFFDIIE